MKETFSIEQPTGKGLSVHETGLGRAVERAPDDPVGFFLEQSNLNTNETGGDFSFLSIPQRAEMLWEIFQEVKSDFVRMHSSEVPLTKAEHDESSQKTELLSSLYNDSETKELYLREIERFNHEQKLLNGSYEKYRQLHGQISELETSFDEISRRMFEQRGVRISALDKLAYQRITRDLEKKRYDLKQMLAEFPRLAARVSCERLQEYSEQLDSERFMWLPSRREILEKIETSALSGRPILLLGESGTGKTSLVKAAARKLTGLAPLKAQGGPSTRLQDSLAKKALSGDGTSVLEYQALGQAITGKMTNVDQEPAHEGGVYFDDEFNNRGKEQQLELIKAVSGLVPGTEETVPMIGKVFVQPRYMFVAAGNPPSDRYDRTPMDPAVRREFGVAITVDYPEQSAENPEFFEAMVASLMDKNGRLRFAKEELSPAWKDKVEGKKKIRELDTDTKKGGVLWRFANAMAELYKSISGTQTVLNDRGVAQHLSEFVLDPGVVFGWLRQAIEQGYSGSLEPYLMGLLKEKLAEPGIPKTDVTLVKDFFAFFDLSVGGAVRTSESKMSVLTPEEVGLLSPRVQYFEVISAPDVRDATAIIGGKTIRYKTEGTLEAPVGSIRIKGSGARTKRWEVKGQTEDGQLIIYSPDVKGEKTTKIPPAEFLTWEAGIDTSVELGKIDMSKLPDGARAMLEGRDIRREFEQLVPRERDTIRKFFGREFPVPRLPAEITLDRYKKWKEQGLELHYLPSVDLVKITKDRQGKITAVIAEEFPGFKEKPGKEYTPGQQQGISFLESIKTGKLSEDAARLPGAWILVDTRKKPVYDNGNQRYDHDILAPVIEDLRQKGIIDDFKMPGSRFNIRPRELEKLEVRTALAKALDIPESALHIPRAIETIYLGNALYPEWHTTNCVEWYEDVYDEGQQYRLYGGFSDSGGLSYVSWGNLDDRGSHIGFRPLGYLS